MNAYVHMVYTVYVYNIQCVHLYSTAKETKKRYMYICRGAIYVCSMYVRTYVHTYVVEMIHLIYSSVMVQVLL